MLTSPNNQGDATIKNNEISFFYPIRLTKKRWNDTMDSWQRSDKMGTLAHEQGHKAGRGQDKIKAKVYQTPKQKDIFSFYQYSLPPGLRILSLGRNENIIHFQIAMELVNMIPEWVLLNLYVSAGEHIGHLPPSSVTTILVYELYLLYTSTFPYKF